MAPGHVASLGAIERCAHGDRIISAPARRNIAVRPDQVGRAGPAVVALPGQPVAGDCDGASRRTAKIPTWFVAECQQAEIASQPVDQPAIADRRMENRPPGPRTTDPVAVAIGRVKRRSGLHRRHRRPGRC